MRTTCENRSAFLVSAIAIILLVFCWCSPQQAAALTAYDDFPAGSINSAKWNSYESVREITTAQKLRLKTRSSRATTGPIESNVAAVNPTSVNTIQAKIAYTSFVNNEGARPFAYVGGRFYNDGVSGDIYSPTAGSYFGEVLAQVAIGGTGLSPKIYWQVVRFNHPTDMSQTSQIATGDFATTPLQGTEYTFTVSWNGTAFTFTAAGETPVTYTPTGTKNAANMPYRGLGTRISGGNAGKEATLEAIFDDVYVNGALYDSFSGSSIDLTKWYNYEFIREVQSSKLESKTRTDTSSPTGWTTNNLEIFNPTAVNVIQADITPAALNNPADIYARAAVSGGFYNDGTLGFGRTGDIWGLVRLEADTAGWVAKWSVVRFTDSHDTSETVHEETFATPIVATNTYTGYVAWDGTQFTFKLGTETVNYTPPAGTKYLIKIPGKNIGTRILTTSSNKIASIEARFDNVMVNYDTDDAQIRGNFAAAIAAYNNKDVNAMMSYFSANYLSDGENFAARKTSFTNDFAPSNSNYQPISVTIDSVAINGTDATVLSTWSDGQSIDYLRRDADGMWRFYGNQARYNVRVNSMHWSNGYYGAGYYTNVSIEDPDNSITSATVSGPGITGTTSLVHGAGTFTGWTFPITSPPPIPFLGATPPGTPQTYTVNITDGTGTYSYQRTITGYVVPFATNLGPGNVNGSPFSFTWTGITGANRYKVELNDANWNRIWQADDLPSYTRTVVYSGPELTAQTYNYVVISGIRTAGMMNESFSSGSFAYNPNGVTFRAGDATANPPTTGVVDGVSGNPLSGVRVELVGDSSVYALSDANGNVSLGGLPMKELFSLKFSLTGYVPTYTGNTYSTGTTTSPRPYGLFTLAQLQTWGIQSGKGVIRGRVAESTNQTSGFVGGVVITARSVNHAATPYNVAYLDDNETITPASINTNSSGKFLVLNVDDGDTVLVSATKDGWGFNARTFLAHADSVSMSGLSGDPVPNVPTYTATAVPHPEPQQQTHGDWFGSPTTSIRDFTGDNVNDLFATAAFQDNGIGKVYLLNGVTGALVQTIQPPTGTAADATYGNFGTSGGTSLNYDLDGGGKHDFVISAPRDTVGGQTNAGRIHLYRGEDRSIIRTIISPNPTTGELFGNRIGMGDVNGDGIPEIIVVASGYNGGQGRIYVVNPFTGYTMLTIDDPSPQANSQFGLRRMTIDLDLDGKAEIVATNYYKNVNSLTEVGVVYIFNDTGALIRTINHPEPQAYAWFGSQLGVLSDIDGDGVSEILVSAPGQDASTPSRTSGRGKAYIFSGATGQLIKSISPPTADAEDGARFGGTVGGLTDINKDGPNDLAIVATNKTVESVANVGKVYLVSGKYGVLFNGSITPPTPDLEANMMFGMANVASQGDANADTIPDITTAARNKTVNSISGAGVVYMFRSVGYSITGSVKDLATNTALSGVTITAINVDTGLQAAGPVYTDGNGNYTIYLPATGSYRINPALAGYEVLTAPDPAGITIDGQNPNEVCPTIYLSLNGIPLSQGWNFVSFPRIPGDGTIELALPALNDASIIWGYNNATQQWVKWRLNGGSNNTLTRFEFGKGYWIYMNAAGMIDVSAWSDPTSTSVSLSAGWNLIGYLGAEGANVGTSLSTLSGNWVIVWNWTASQWYGKHYSITTLPSPLLPLTQFNLQKAYWLKMRQATGWTQ
jgi:hypothetical protein